MAADSMTQREIERHKLPKSSAVWFGDQKKLFRHLEGNRSSFPVGWDKESDTENTKLYGAFKSKEELYPALNSLDMKYRSCYEYIIENTDARLYADIECKFDIKDPDKIDEQLADENETFATKLDRYLSLLRKFFVDTIGQEPRLIVERCGENDTACRVVLDKSQLLIKASVHVVIENYCFTANNEGRALLKQIMTLDNEAQSQFGEFVDVSVFSRNRLLRGLGMIKKSDLKPIPFVLDEVRTENFAALSKSPELALVTHVPDGCINILDLLPSTPSLARMLPKGPLQRHKRDGRNTTKEESKQSRSGRADPLIASAMTACQELLRAAGDTESTIYYRGNKNAEYDFQGRNPPGGRECLANPAKSGKHNKNNFSIYVSKVSSSSHLFDVKYSCESPSCQRSSFAGTKKTCLLGRILQDGKKFRIWTVEAKRTIRKAAGSPQKEAMLPKQTNGGSEERESVESSLINIEHPPSAGNKSGSAQMDIDCGGGPNSCEGNEKDQSVGLDAVHQNGSGNKRRRPRPDEDGGEGSDREEICDVDNSRRTRQRIGENGGECEGNLEVGADGDDWGCGDDCDDTIVGNGCGDDNEQGVTSDKENGGKDVQFDYILSSLNPARFTDKRDLLILYQVCKNETQLEVLRCYCQFDEKDFPETNQFLTPQALIDWLRLDNYEAYKTLLSDIVADYEGYKYSSQHKLANLYYNMNPYQYLFDSNLGWCEFNEYNVLVIRKETPPSLISDISKRLGHHFEDLISLCPDYVNANDEGSVKKNKEPRAKIEMKRACTSVGTASFVKGIAEYLKSLCQISNLTDKIDSNRNLLAFENKVFDLDLGRTRQIHTSDFITKTTKYKINLTRNSEIKEHINAILQTIFGDDQMIAYWWKTIALSTFGRSFESFYVHTGGGRNGKGLVAGILQDALGDYFQTADNAFLTTSFDSARPNSVLAQCHGKRFLCVSEPETGKPNCSLTVDFVKYITGNDAGINTRDLNSKAFTFKPLFTPVLLCNEKPRLNKVDTAIEERLKIIEYPFKFVDKPTLPNEKRKDNDLKTKVKTPIFINEFILMLCDVAFQNKDIPYIQLPEQVAKNTSEYVDENNVIKHFIHEHYEVTCDPRDCVKSSDLLAKYNYHADQKLTASQLKAQMTFNGFKLQPKKDANYYTGLKAKSV
jgi:P4 family phage/plasmid primase-like protien